MIQVYIEQKPCNTGVGIYIYEERNGKMYLYQTTKLTIKECKAGTSEEPTIKFNYPIVNELLQALQEAIVSIGIKPKEGNKIEGLYEATKEHLNDMRKLVFKKYKQKDKE